MYFGISDYGQFRFPLIYRRLDAATALTSQKYPIRCLMDRSELCDWHQYSSEEDCERCRLWEAWWRSLTPQLSNALGFTRCQKVTLLIDVWSDFANQSINFWRPDTTTQHLAHSLFINGICLIFIFHQWVKVSIWPLKRDTSTSVPSFPHIYGSQMMYPMPLALLWLVLSCCCWSWHFLYIIERPCDR